MTPQQSISAFGLKLEDEDCWYGEVDFSYQVMDFSLTHFCSTWRASVSCDELHIDESWSEGDSLTFDEWLDKIDELVEESSEPEQFYDI